MSGPRVVLISRRFWPVVGGAESVMANLGEEFARQGLEVTLLTAHSNPQWSTEVKHRGINVVRLPQPPQRWWGTWQYMRAIAAWLRDNRQRFDIVYVSMFKHDAYAAVGEGLRLRFPVAIRAEGAGLTGDMHWQLAAVGGRRIKRRCFKAAAFIAPSEIIHREIVAAGYPRSRIHYLPNGVSVPNLKNLSEPAMRDAREEARRALASASPHLRISFTAPLAVYTGRLHHAKGLDDLVRAWELVVAEKHEARLWIAGEGEYQSELADLIRQHGLEESVIIAGSFDSVDTLLTAADLFVLPSHEEGMSISLLEAMAAALPVVATDVAGNRNLIDHEKHGLLVPKANSPHLAAAILRLFDDQQTAQQLAGEARKRVVEEFSLETMAHKHLELFEQLLKESSAA